MSEWCQCLSGTRTKNTLKDRTNAERVKGNKTQKNMQKMNVRRNIATNVYKEGTCTENRVNERTRERTKCNETSIKLCRT